MSLKSIRISRKITQKQLAEMCGISKQEVFHLENGNRDINRATIRVLALLCKNLNCKLTDIITDPKILELLSK